MSLSVLCIILSGYLYITYVFSLQIIPERAVAHFINDSYAKDVVINVRKLGRKGGYVVNLNFTILYEIGHNITDCASSAATHAVAIAASHAQFQTYGAPYFRLWRRSALGDACNVAFYAAEHAIKSAYMGFSVQEKQHNHYYFKVDILFFEFLHNEYKRTFVEMHFSLCEMIYNDQLLGMAVRNAGFTTCPIKAGTYQMYNMSIPNVENFPYVWPFERAQATGIFTNPKTGVFVANGSVFFTFKNTKRKSRP